MKYSQTLMIPLLLVLVQVTVASEAGLVCVAPVEKPKTGTKSLANPSGGNQVQSYSVQIDDRPPINVSGDQSVAIDRLSLSGKHAVQVRGDGKDITSFHFRFNDYSSHHLCLWFKPLYETWSLTPARGHGKACACHELTEPSPVQQSR